MVTASQATKWGLIAIFLFAMGAAITWAQRGNAKPKVSRAKVLADYPHDADAFTQGLVIHDGKMYEGTGQYGRSTLRRVEISTGKVLQSLSLDPRYFGEGITVLAGKIYQLTWKERVMFVFDEPTMKYERMLRIPFEEGWGITHNGKDLIVSDGSSAIRFLDPANGKERRKITVREGRNKLKSLNELEYVDGQIWANIWYEDRIARMDKF
jgi:glutamine cyclotransferase